MPMNSGKERVYHKTTKDRKPQQQILAEKAALVQGTGSEDYF